MPATERARIAELERENRELPPSQRDPQLVRRRGPWRSLDDLELATLEWVDWWNHRRLHQALGYVPPAECETHHCREPAPAGC